MSLFTTTAGLKEATDSLLPDMAAHRKAISDGAKYLAEQINQAKEKKERIVKRLLVGPEYEKLINDAEAHLQEIKSKFRLSDSFDVIG